MVTGAAKRAYRRGFLGLPNFLAAYGNSKDIAASLGLPYHKLFLGVVASGWKNMTMMAYLANAFKMIRIATEEGDTSNGVLPVGQTTGLLKDIPTVTELLERIAAEAAEIRERVNDRV